MEHIGEGNDSPGSDLIIDMADKADDRPVWIVVWGGASARFHRPAYRNDPDAHNASTEWGLGLSPRAQTTSHSAGMLADSFDIFAGQPQNELLSDRAADEAYARANPGRQYAVYFPYGGNVRLDVSAIEKPLKLRWLNIDDGTWQAPQRVDNRERLTLQPPGQEDWAVVVEGRLNDD